MTERKARSKRRRWCRIGKTHQDEDDPICCCEHGDILSHRLRVRRMLVCSACSQAYFTKEAFDEHFCDSAYGN